MLSRVAGSIYWMERYLERADNTARFMEVSKYLSMDAKDNVNLWSSLVKASGSNDLYRESKLHYSAEEVIHFLTFDKSNPNSIIMCLNSARDNARSIREVITEDLWEVVNSMYYLVKDQINNADTLKDPLEMLHILRMKRMTFMGLMNNTMLMQEAFHHACIGRFLERADMTSRILDVKYFTLLPSYAKVGSAIDTIQWSALLESTDSVEMYLQQKGTISPKKIVDFLIFCEDFPRSIFFSLKMAQKSIHAISGTAIGGYTLNCEKMIGKMCSGMSYISAIEVIEEGLHEYLDILQIQIAKTSESIGAEYYTPYKNTKGIQSELLNTHE